MKKLQFGVLLSAALALFAEPILAQDNVTTDDIIQSLKPKPRTRGLGAPTLSADDAAFLNKVKHQTRGLTIEERIQITTIVSTAVLPAIDLEVNFAFNSATLEPSAVLTLQKLGAALQSEQLANASFLIAGHTDARGAKDYNQKLSEARAQTVKTFLAGNFHITPDQLLAVGYGQEQLKNTADPFADENRRVKIINLGKN
jgi:outer membrane protein OmpA-like peptidoglycan-associated protein